MPLTKYQEKTFKDYVREIEFLTGNYYDWIRNKPFNAKMVSLAIKDLKETRVSFLNWFKKQTLRENKILC